MKKTKQKLRIESIADRYAGIVNEYLELFIEKQGLQFDFWVADKVGEVCFCSDYYLDFKDMKHDIDNKVAKGKILKYYEYVLENSEKFDYKITYECYLKGQRYGKAKN